MPARTTRTLVSSFALIVAATVVGIGSPAGAATTELGPIAGICTFDAIPALNEFDLYVTLTLPDQVGAGESFDAEVTIDFDDLPDAPLVVSDFQYVSSWVVTGGATPSGPITVATPPRNYDLGDSIIADTVTVPFTATGAAGDVVSFQITDAWYQFSLSGPGGAVVVTDCTFEGFPMEVASVSIVGETLTCLGHPVTITGTPNSDVIVGTNGPDVIHAIDGDNVVFGLGGDDIICGGPGTDVIFGGTGNDRIDGGGGVNFLIGGPGIDTCTNGLAITC
jgi:Ca2+-binding RTX toxin-like protein